MGQSECVSDHDQGSTSCQNSLFDDYHTWAMLGPQDLCPDGLFLDAETLECTICLDKLMVPNVDRTQCVCPDGFSSATRPTCHRNDIEQLNQPAAISKCWACGELECVTGCSGSTIEFPAGWSPVVHGNGTGTEVAIFACKNEAACPAGIIVADVPSENCTEGYTSTLCGGCEDGYVLKKKKTCSECGSTSPAGFIAAFVMLILLALLATKVRALYNNLSTLQEIEDIRQVLMANRRTG